MNNYFYPAIFSKEGNSYNVRFIDFDNIFTFGIRCVDSDISYEDMIIKEK